MFRKSEKIVKPTQPLQASVKRTGCNKEFKNKKTIPNTFRELLRDPEWSIIVKKAISSGVMKFPLCILIVSAVLLLGEYFIMDESFKMPTSLLDIHPFVIFWVILVSFMISWNFTWHLIDKYGVESGLAEPGEIRRIFSDNSPRSDDSSTGYTFNSESRSVNSSSGLPITGGGVDVGGHSRGSR